MNNADIHSRVETAMSSLIHNKGFAAPVDVLMELGVLSKEDYENWRFGRVPYLEKVCKTNLSKLSTIMHEIRVFAENHNLKESWSDYRTGRKGGSATRLRFSKSGSEAIERGYATHFVSLEKVRQQTPPSSDP